MIENSQTKISCLRFNCPAQQGAIGVKANQVLIGAKPCSVRTYVGRCKPQGLVKYVE